MLIVDDSAPFRARLTGLLSRIDGIEIAGEAANVADAIESVRVLKPDAVILDIQMPGGSGIDVLRHVKENYPSIVTIMLTNHAHSQYQQRCAELGADYFLKKATGSKPLVDICKRLTGVKNNVQ